MMFMVSIRTNYRYLKIQFYFDEKPMFSKHNLSRLNGKNQ